MPDSFLKDSHYEAMKSIGMSDDEITKDWDDVERFLVERMKEEDERFATSVANTK